MYYHIKLKNNACKMTSFSMQMASHTGSLHVELPETKTRGGVIRKLYSTLAEKSDNF